MVSWSHQSGAVSKDLPEGKKGTGCHWLLNLFEKATKLEDAGSTGRQTSRKKKLEKLRKEKSK